MMNPAKIRHPFLYQDRRQECEVGSWHRGVQEDCARGHP
jgi:hypothetical protein